MERLADEKMRLKKVLLTSQQSPAERQQLESQIASYTKAMLHLTNQRVQMLAVESMSRDEESLFCSKVADNPPTNNMVPRLSVGNNGPACFTMSHFWVKFWQVKPNMCFPLYLAKLQVQVGVLMFVVLYVLLEVDVRPQLTRVLSKPIEAEFIVADVAPLPLNTILDLNAPLSKVLLSAFACAHTLLDCAVNWCTLAEQLRGQGADGL